MRVSALGLGVLCAVGVFCAAQADSTSRPDAAAQAKSQISAKQLFGKVTTPSPQAPESIGFYAKGCLAGAQALPADGEHWQRMRLSRHRQWGHPALLAFLTRYSAQAAQATGWPGILVGDMSQVRGGPMLGGHASHQVGLDVDIWYEPMPGTPQTAEQREQRAAISLVRADRLDINPNTWTPAHRQLLEAAALQPEVQRIFVNAAIKKQLCRTAKGSDWMRKVRPYYGHDDHFHVRLMCPEGEAQCTAQEATPEGDGCDASLDWWFSDEALNPKPGPAKPPLTLGDLPSQCQTVLEAK
jgi:penicillin-insensitive murein endopeptidase